MKVTLERNHLLKSLGHVHRVVERRNTYPILANVLLKAADGKLDLRATDLDIEVTESVPAMVGQAGTTTVPAHTLYEIVRKLADDITWAVRSPDTVEKLTAAGAIAGGGTPEEFRKFLSSETERWGQIIRDLGMKPE